ncbi:MAG: methyltransferase domain-containing protein [Devosia nanyangense]|uniref:Methyltransferase domain-containing protein n=1 Tax=Devosia nanyangense TaxID=1228055 RepID=A0A933L118_9HYPH|nr:methyltransferase domain-containing protein [Devosia nanyangense]
MSRDLAPIAAYYAQKLAEHGQAARGVDWNGEESQVLRFEQLARIIDLPPSFSVNDLGCGYGALFDFLAARYEGFSYRGIDVSAEMVAAARGRLGTHRKAAFELGEVPSTVADFGIASGIFNVRLDSPDGDWVQHVETTLEAMDRTSTRGFAFNCLTSYSDADRMRAHLYYCDPLRLFDFCKRRFSRNVALLHDYGLYEFTILVRKR